MAGRRRQYVEQGEAGTGSASAINGKQVQSFPSPDGSQVQTAPLLTNAAQSNPYRGAVPGSRAPVEPGARSAMEVPSRPGSGNDTFALSATTAADDAVHVAAREFTVFDQWHAPILGPTYPNRAYLHSGQSGDYKTNMLPFATGGYDWETIWDRLGAAGVPAAYYYTDLPVLSRCGAAGSVRSRTRSRITSRRPKRASCRVVFVDPAFLGDNRTDDHPRADIRAGQRFPTRCIRRIRTGRSTGSAGPSS